MQAILNFTRHSIGNQCNYKKVQIMVLCCRRLEVRILKQTVVLQCSSFYAPAGGTLITVVSGCRSSTMPTVFTWIWSTWHSVTHWWTHMERRRSLTVPTRRRCYRSSSLTSAQSSSCPMCGVTTADRRRPPSSSRWRPTSRTHSSCTASVHRAPRTSSASNLFKVRLCSNCQWGVSSVHGRRS